MNILKKMKIKSKIMKTIVVTQREIQEVMKRSVYVNKKKYTRKTKHKKIQSKYEE